MITVQSVHFPISTNALFANIPGRGRVRSKRYKEWAAAAGWDANGKGSISGPFALNIILSRSKRRSNADLDNLSKGIIDLLVAHKIVDDDKYLERMTLAWGDCDGFHVEVSEA